MSKSVAEIFQGFQGYRVGLRRRVDALPALSFHEQGTCQLVQAELTAMNSPCKVVGDHGVVATVEGTSRPCGDATGRCKNFPASPRQDERNGKPVFSAARGTRRRYG